MTNTKHINQVKINIPSERDALVRKAAATADTCVSVGGLAESFGMTSSAMMPAAGQGGIGPRALARLIEFWRRRQRLSISQLAERAGLDEQDVLDAERGEAEAEPRVLHALSSVLGVSYDKLLDLAGHTKERSEPLSEAAVRFAASSESMDKLSKQEESALNDFIKVLAK